MYSCIYMTLLTIRRLREWVGNALQMRQSLTQQDHMNTQGGFPGEQRPSTTLRDSRAESAETTSE